MPTIREILKKNNIELDISTEALNLEFEGEFIFTGTAQERKWNLLDQSDEFVLSFLFHDGENRIMIVPDDPDYVVNYTHVHNDGTVYFEAYDSNGSLSLNT